MDSARDDDVAHALELLDNMNAEDRLIVLQHYQKLLAEPDYLSGGGMASGPMLIPDLDTGAAVPPVLP